MNELVVIGIGPSYPCFVKQGDIIKEYEIVLDKFRAPRIKVKPHHYLSVNEKNMSLFEFGLCGKYNLEQIPIFINIDDVKVIKGNEGERKMKYELRDTAKSWWVEGMIVEGEIKGTSEILEINSIDICRLNKDIMSKEQIIECMEARKYGWGKDYLKEIKPTFTMLEKLLLEHQLEMGYKYITRDLVSHKLNFFKNKPVTNGRMWFGKDENNYPVYDMYLTELYPFVSSEDKEPTLIQDILDKYEVIENEKI